MKTKANGNKGQPRRLTLKNVALSKLPPKEINHQDLSSASGGDDRDLIEKHVSDQRSKIVEQETKAYNKTGGAIKRGSARRR